MFPGTENTLHLFRVLEKFKSIEVLNESYHISEKHFRLLFTPAGGTVAFQGRPVKKFFILSIDGGGIRGIIPSIFLCSLKDILEKRGFFEPYHKIFDLMAGTSTGGLISLALSVPLYKEPDGYLYDVQGGVSVQKIPEMYATLGEKVFPGSRHLIRKAIRQLFTSKYSSLPFYYILRDIFKDCTVKNALTNVLITAFDMGSMQPVFIKKRPEVSGGDTDPDYYMADSALATAAVPTYFPPAYVGQLGSAVSSMCLIDGGIFCINPAMSALTEARKICPDSEYIILSLGTGTQTENYDAGRIKNWGSISWISPWLGVPLISAVGEGQRISTNHMLRKLPRVTLFRFDTELEDKKGRIDDGSGENLSYLKEKALSMIDSNIDQMERLAQIIIHSKTAGTGY